MNHFQRLITAALAIALFLPARAAADLAASVEPALSRYAADFASDPSLDREIMFGIEVAKLWWTIKASPGANHAPGRVTLHKGRPSSPTFYFTIDSAETLALIDSGRLAALTAMGKAHESDMAPMDLGVMEGFAPDQNFGAWLIPFAFHFWTRGTPEIIPFGPDAPRIVHGANMGVLYYHEGFRSAYFAIRPGKHVNADARDQTNPFPTLIIGTRGRVNARLGGRDLVLSEGQAVFIPAGMTHEFTNTFNEVAEGILLMFGPGA